MIYSYEKFIESYDWHDRFGSYNSEVKYTCKYNSNLCGFVQILFAEHRNITWEWEEITVEKLRYSPAVPYFLVYISPYSQEVIAAGQAKYFKKFLHFVRATTIGLYVVTTTNNSKCIYVLNIACLHCIYYKQVLIEVPGNINRTLSIIWHNEHKNAHLGYLASNDYDKTTPKKFASLCMNRGSENRYPSICILNQIKHYLNLTLERSSSAGILALTVKAAWYKLERTLYMH